jgi:hypothetical protein
MTEQMSPGSFMGTTPGRGTRICCPDCSDSLAAERGSGCETCGHTGYLVIEAAEVL